MTQGKAQAATTTQKFYLFDYFFHHVRPHTECNSKTALKTLLFLTIKKQLICFLNPKICDQQPKKIFYLKMIKNN